MNLKISAIKARAGKNESCIMLIFKGKWPDVDKFFFNTNAQNLLNIDRDFCIILMRQNSEAWFLENYKFSESYNNIFEDSSPKVFF